MQAALYMCTNVKVCGFGIFSLLGKLPGGKVGFRCTATLFWTQDLFLAVLLNIEQSNI